MTQKSLKDRISALEDEVAELKRSKNASPPKDWRSTIGMFGNDEVMKRIFENALAYREKDRQQARKRRRGKRQPKQ